jgi:hypothetical protein
MVCTGDRSLCLLTSRALRSEVFVPECKGGRMPARFAFDLRTEFVAGVILAANCAPASVLKLTMMGTSRDVTAQYLCFDTSYS